MVLFIHRIEYRKPTNTGRLACECLANSKVYVRGLEDRSTDGFVAEPGSRPVLLFPHADAISLTEFAGDSPVTLIVPDGTWRQAAKVRNRVPGLSDLPCVTLPQGAASTYRLRAEAHSTGLATLEAIARSLEILEGAQGPSVRAALERVFDAMVNRALWARGALRTDEVVGLPAGVRQHDPLSGERSMSRASLPQRFGVHQPPPKREDPI